MVKKIVCSAALLAALMLLFAGLVAAQDLSQIKPTASIAEQFLVRPTSGVLKSPFNLLKLNAQKNLPLQPSYCNPCLFYAGDGDPSNLSTANGLWDNNSMDFGIDGSVYTPFTVPKKTDKCGGTCKWSVSEMFANIQYVPTPPVAPTDVAWSIVTGVVEGGTPPGTVICSGIDTAPVLTDTGRLWFGIYEEWTTAVSVSGCPALSAKGKEGKSGAEFWQTVVPEFGGGNFQLAYEADAEDNGPAGVPAEAYGEPQPWDASFFVSAAFGFPNFSATWGSTGVGAGLGCDRFSAGVEGTLVKKQTDFMEPGSADLP